MWNASQGKANGLQGNRKMPSLDAHKQSMCALLHFLFLKEQFLDEFQLDEYYTYTTLGNIWSKEEYHGGESSDNR